MLRACQGANRKKEERSTIIDEVANCDQCRSSRSKLKGRVYKS